MRPPLSLEAVLMGTGMRPVLARGLAAHLDVYLHPAGGSDYLAELLTTWLSRQVNAAYSQGRADGEAATAGQLTFWSGQPEQGIQQ